MSTLNKIKEEAAIDYAEKRFTNIDDQIKAAEAFAMGFELAQELLRDPATTPVNPAAMLFNGLDSTGFYEPHWLD